MSDETAIHTELPKFPFPFSEPLPSSFSSDELSDEGFLSTTSPLQEFTLKSTFEYRCGLAAMIISVPAHEKHNFVRRFASEMHLSPKRQSPELLHEVSPVETEQRHIVDSVVQDSFSASIHFLGDTQLESLRQG